MSESFNNIENGKENFDVAAKAAQKAKLLKNFYEIVKKADEFLTADDLKVAMESLKIATMEVREKEEAENRRKEAERKIKLAAEEAEKRAKALEKVRKEAETKHKAHVDEVTCMDLPMDWRNNYSEDERASEHFANISDAFVFCLDTFGAVDIEFIAQITGKECKTIINELKGSIFQNPLTWNECFYKGWETADEYLSGNIMLKYAKAKEANNEYLGYFDDNIKALEEIMNPEIATEDIYVTLGSPWIPSDVIDDFILHMVGLDPVDGIYGKEAKEFLVPSMKVIHDEHTGLWEIPAKNRFKAAQLHGKYEEAIFDKYGTNRMPMLNLLENILNMKTLSVMDTVEPYGTVRVMNKEATVQLLEKQDRMIDEFKKWVWLDKDRKQRLQNAYCNKYGNIRKRNYDGSFLKFPNMNPNTTLFPYQKNAVARILFSQNTLLAHEVGSGKTYEMIAAGMELRRLGKSKKNLYVVPNNILSSWKKIYKEMYPDANVLYVDNTNFNNKKRANTLKRIIKEDFDGIIMTYSCFDRLSLSDKYYMNMYQDSLNKLEEAEEMFNCQGKIERRKKKITKLLDEIKAKTTKHVKEISFDDLGINTLFVDEAHNYKNVEFATNITKVLGVGGASAKCTGMMDKVHCVQRNNNGGRIIFATGTPITNSITDIFVMQKYLQDGELEFLGLSNFDAWAGMFAQKTTEFEIDVDTNSYHLATRFAQFKNIPELSSILSSVADFHQCLKQNNVPEFEGYTDSVREGSDDFKNYLKEISLRADDIRQKRVSRFDDNLLKITSDGRKAALDLRLIDEAYGLDPESKVFRCAENIIDVYEKTNNFKGTQLVFCDSSTPKKSFNLYNELKSLLVAMNIPESEIVFIHDACTDTKRTKLFADVNNGTVRVLVGSTFKMGLGVNVQERLSAVHHLDVPWRPADMIQREGRIIRQGNINKTVQIFRYITKGSFDAYSWQLLETKQRFISQILSGNATQREGGDVDASVLNYAEVKALSVGNPLIKKRVEISNELDKYKILQSEITERRFNAKRELTRLPKAVEELKKKIALIEEDFKYISHQSTEFEVPDAKEKIAIRDSIIDAVTEKANLPYDYKILTYRGFEVIVPRGMQPRKINNKLVPYIQVKRNASYIVDVESKSGITTRLDNLLSNLDRGKSIVRITDRDTRSGIEHELESSKSKLQDMQTKIATLKSLISGNEDYSEKIEDLKDQLREIDEQMGIAA